MQAVVFGNVALDVICKTVDDVPRERSIGFEQAAVSPGGCASNVAIGLAALGIDTALVARTGADDAGLLLERTWQERGLDLRWVQRTAGQTTAVSVGLVDSQLKPRFIYTPGANAHLTGADLDLESLAAQGARGLHVAGFFVLPGLLDGHFPAVLARAHQLGLFIVLDVVQSPAMDHPEPLWPCLPHLDVFLCNDYEAWQMTGEREPRRAAQALQERGAGTVIVKLGGDGCWLQADPQRHPGLARQVPTTPAPVVDTTGAGDAFAAGFMAACLAEAGLEAACQAGHQAGARIVGSLGALTGWDPTTTAAW